MHQSPRIGTPAERCPGCGHETSVGDRCQECGCSRASFVSQPLAEHLRRRARWVVLMCRAVPRFVLAGFMALLASISLFPSDSIMRSVGAWSMLAGLAAAMLSFAGVSFGALVDRPFDSPATRRGILLARVLSTVMTVAGMWSIAVGVLRSGGASTPPWVAWANGGLWILVATSGTVACWLIVMFANQSYGIFASAFGVPSAEFSRRDAIFWFAIITVVCWTTAIVNPRGWFPQGVIMWALLSLYVTLQQIRGTLSPLLEKPKSAEVAPHHAPLG